MATAKRYYIQVDTYWSNAKDYFVGPFASREEARAAVEAIPTDSNAWLATSTCGGDIREAVRVYPQPLSHTAARRAGMRAYRFGDQTDNLLGRHMPRTARELDAHYEITAS